MLFAPLDAETKYKAKNTIDTVVYRAGDVISGWIYTGIVFVASTGAVAIAGVAVAAVWGLLGYAIGRRHDRSGRAPAPLSAAPAGS